MPKAECITCSRYKQRTCDFEQGDYYKYKQCMLGQKSYYDAAEHEEEEDELCGYTEITG